MSWERSSGHASTSSQTFTVPSSFVAALCLPHQPRHSRRPKVQQRWLVAALSHTAESPVSSAPKPRRASPRRKSGSLDGAKLKQWLEKRYQEQPVRQSSSQQVPSAARPEEQLGKALVHLSADADVGQVLEGVTLQGRHITRLLSYVGEHASPRRALAVFEWLDCRPEYQTRDCFIYTRLMSLFSRSPSDPRTALRIFDSMQAAHVQPDLVAFNAAISAAGKAGEWNAMLRVFKSMQSAGVRPDVYTFTSLIKACQTCGNRWQKAIAFFRQMRQSGVQPNVQAYTALVGVCSHAGQHEAAMDTLQAMDAAGVQPDVRAFNGVLAACAAGGKWESAWAVMAAMRRSGAAPSAVSFNLLMSACERAGQPERVLEVFTRMQRDAVRRGALAPTLVTYNTVLSACAKGGMHERAMQLYHEMQAQQLQPDIFTLTSLLHACDRAGKGWQQSVGLAHEFQRQGVKLNAFAVNILIQTLGKWGEWEQAMQLFQKMKMHMDKPDLRPNLITYANLIAACRNARQYQLAFALYDQLQEQGLQPSAYVFDYMLDICKEGGFWQDGLEILKIMQAREDINTDGLAMAALEALFRNPAIASAARAAIASGRATRRWIDASHH
ncbi:hypothetical protein WJX73_008405 [Symbiochloris irregularis]|uniref:PROP1-like PPR domain-containing protein n=1 Tax=Symbiochloris irregularis TaxID=706552 RepID=A0AAW1NNB1_9CHLO